MEEGSVVSTLTDARDKKIRLHSVGWLVGLGVTTLFGSFKAELSHFDKFQIIQFSISIFLFTHD